MANNKSSDADAAIEHLKSQAPQEYVHLLRLAWCLIRTIDDEQFAPDIKDWMVQFDKLKLHAGQSQAPQSTGGIKRTPTPGPGRIIKNTGADKSELKENNTQLKVPQKDLKYCIDYLNTSLARGLTAEEIRMVRRIEELEAIISKPQSTATFPEAELRKWDAENPNVLSNECRKELASIMLNLGQDTK